MERDSLSFPKFVFIQDLRTDVSAQSLTLTIVTIQNFRGYKIVHESCSIKHVDYRETKTQTIPHSRYHSCFVSPYNMSFVQGGGGAKKAGNVLGRSIPSTIFCYYRKIKQLKYNIRDSKLFCLLFKKMEIACDYLLLSMLSLKV